MQCVGCAVTMNQSKRLKERSYSRRRMLRFLRAIEAKKPG